MDHGLSTMDKRASCACRDEWRVFVDGTLRSAVEQMACDERLAQAAAPTVRVFRWDSPALSLGWKQLRPAWCNHAQTGGVDLVERPTGGGLAVHGSDVSIAVVVPRAWGDSLRRWMQTVCKGAADLCEGYGVRAECLLDLDRAERIAYCLTERSPYAVLAGGRKVAGFAARRYPQAWLIQGSLVVNPLPSVLQGVLPGELRASLATRAVSLAEVAQEPVSDSDVASRWAEILLRNIFAE